ncbi:MAG: histidine kinase [Pseudonocardia sp.]|nr:histidine kinase [Pseudonocardia sp.]
MTTGRFETVPLSSDSARIVHRLAGSGDHVAFWVAAWILLGAGALSVLVSLLSRGPPVSFLAVTVVFRIVGGSFAACGLVAWRRRPDNHSGRLMTATGFAFLASPLLAQLDSSLARTAGLLLRNVWLLLLVAILLTFLTGGRLRTRTDRTIVWAVAVSLVVISPLWLMFLEVEGNLLFVQPAAEIAKAVDGVQQWLYLPIALAVTAVVASRWRSASRPGRRALLPSVAGSVYLLFFTAVLTAGLVGVPPPYAVYWVLAFSVAIVPVAFLTGLLRSRLARGGLVDLFRGMRALHPVDLRAALARALGDPSLVIAYPVPGGFVDSDGRPVTLPGEGGDRSVVPVERDGEINAVLVYDRSLDDDPELVEAVGGATAIALENQHLHVEAEARLAEVLASRERVIAAGDAERRRIERNLHDGAQQRLVTLALQLSLIGRQIRVDPSDAEQLVTSASDELAQSLEELRELARGIHPAALDQGLDVALDALAVRSAVPTTVSCDPGPRLPEPVAFAAYLVASEALANIARYAHATAVTVRLVRTGDGAVIEVTDDGIGGADPARGSGLRGLADRVEALDGRLRVSSPTGAGTIVTAQLPVSLPTAG